MLKFEQVNLHFYVFASIEIQPECYLHATSRDERPEKVTRRCLIFLIFLISCVTTYSSERTERWYLVYDIGGREVMVSRRPELQDETRLHVMRLLHENPKRTTRELAKLVGVSNGSAYYLPSGSFGEGACEIGQFCP